MIKRSVGEYIFDTINIILLILVAVVTLYPFWYTLVASISSPDAVAAGKVFLWPIGFELSSYIKVSEIPYIWHAYGNTIFISVVGTAVNIILTICGRVSALEDASAR